MDGNDIQNSVTIGIHMISNILSTSYFSPIDSVNQKTIANNVSLYGNRAVSFLVGGMRQLLQSGVSSQIKCICDYNVSNLINGGGDPDSLEVPEDPRADAPSPPPPPPDEN